MSFGNNPLAKLMLPVLLFCVLAFSQTPLELNGELRVDGNRIVGEHGNPVQLMGMSHYWSIWGPQKFYNRGVVSWLADDWKVDVIRAAMAVSQEGAGWMHDKEYHTKLVDSVIAAAVDAGIYVIVDWHTHEIHLDGAKEFFGMMAQKYKDCPNIIWEIFNEPEYQTWTQISAYAEEVIATIRQYSDNLVLCGTRSWSQRVDEAAANPLSDNNTAYVLHFYAGTHGASLRSMAERAMNDGIAIFISEYGTTDAGGGKEDRTVYKVETDEWISWALDHNLSMANWSIADLSEVSAVLKPVASKLGGWNPETDLTESGKFIRQWIRTVNTDKYGDGPVNLTVNVIGPGSVQISPQKDSYEKNETVTLKAVADANGRFLNWKGSVSGQTDSVSIVLNSSKRITANFLDMDAPLVQNGDFSRGDTAWSQYIQGSSGALAEFSTDSSKMRAEITDAGTAVWHVQFFQGDIVLLGAHEYQFTFEAAADSARDMVVSVKHNGSPYTEYFVDTITLGTDMQSYTFTFPMMELDDNARVEFNVGEFSTQPVTVTSVGLEIIGTIPVQWKPAVSKSGHNIFSISRKSSLVQIGFDLGKAQYGVIRIGDLRGRVLQTRNVAGAGLHSVLFDGSRHAAGMYLVSLECEGKVYMEKLLLSK